MDEVNMARTESAFRDVNEVIAKSNDPDADEADFVCECADPHCADRLKADLADYEQVRADPTHFLVAPGHEEPAVECVVQWTAEYTVVQKVGEVVSRLVRHLDPRAETA